MSKLGGRAPTKFRRAFQAWEAGPGQQYIRHTPGRLNYLRRPSREGRDGVEISDRPFPNNSAFRSQPVLSKELKEEVWEAVTKRGMSLRAASVEYKMDIRRVAAVIRLKEVEKKWVAEGKQLAVPYSRAVMEMLPQTPLMRPRKQHEPINDLMVHPLTMRQVFWPTAESQHFTRVEAGQAFGDNLLPAEARIPHPQLYAIEKGVAEGSLEDVIRSEEWDKIEKADAKAKQKLVDRVKDREARTTTVHSPRWAFKFEDVVVDTRSTGRHAKGIGARYGVPHEDRKKGQVKIPTRVDG